MNNVGQLLPGKEGVQECVGGREITEEYLPQESRRGDGGLDRMAVVDTRKRGSLSYSP